MRCWKFVPPNASCSRMGTKNRNQIRREAHASPSGWIATRGVAPPTDARVRRRDARGSTSRAGVFSCRCSPTSLLIGPATAQRRSSISGLPRGASRMPACANARSRPSPLRTLVSKTDSFEVERDQRASERGCASCRACASSVAARSGAVSGTCLPIGWPWAATVSSAAAERTCSCSMWTDE